MAALLSRCLRPTALLLITLCYCLSFASPLIVARPAWFQQRPNSSSLAPNIATVPVAATKKDVSEGSLEQTESPTIVKKKAVRKKKTSSAKAQGTKEKKNGVKTESKKTRTKKKKKPEGAVYWRNETDYFLLLDRDLNNVTSTDDAHMIRFLVRGNPRPLRRHRTARGFMYNPSSKYQASFRKIVQEMVWTTDDEPQPFFTEEDQLVMRLVFHMKRPKLHFVGGKPGPGRLRPVAPGRLAPTRTDVDNLAKFVLDSLNGLLYVDDRQVASIQATKIYDNDGHCQGRIEVSIQRLAEDDVDGLLSSSTMPPQFPSDQ